MTVLGRALYYIGQRRGERLMGHRARQSRITFGLCQDWLDDCTCTRPLHCTTSDKRRGERLMGHRARQSHITFGLCQDWLDDCTCTRLLHCTTSDKRRGERLMGH